jgi:hypothetical protein
MSFVSFLHCSYRALSLITHTRARARARTRTHAHTHAHIQYSAQQTALLSLFQISSITVPTAQSQYVSSPSLDHHQGLLVRVQLHKKN